MESVFEMQRRIQFAETDMAGITHFSNYFRYMEETEHAFLRSRGLSVAFDDDKGKLGFPKLHAECDYKRPTRYEEVMDARAIVRCEDGKSISYDITFRSEQELLCSGQLRVAFCRFPLGKPPYAIPIPETVLQKLFG